MTGELKMGSASNSLKGMAGITRREFTAGAAALGLSAVFGPKAFAQEPQRGGHLVVATGGSGTGDGLDPAFFNADFMNTFGPQLYDALMVIDENVSVQPALAESWEAKPGAQEWVVKLRKGVSFHNGKEMTASDVVFSINHHRGEGSKSAARALVRSFSEIKATGTHEVIFILESGNADLPYMLADHHLFIVPEGSNYTDGVGTGAFVLESFEPGVRAVSKRNANDYRSDRGYVDSVEVIAINDSAARLSALLSGSAHLICKVEPNSVGQVEAMPGLQVFNVAGSGHSTFPMRCDTAPFDNLDLRLAMKYAIDREAILHTLLRGNGTIGNDQPIPFFDPAYSDAIPQRPYDPDKAKFHFKKSGHDGPLVLSVSDGAFAGATDMALIFQDSAAKAGITIEVNRVPKDGYYNTIWLKNPFCAGYWGGRPTADIMLSTAYLSTAPWNESHWNRPEFDKLLLAARSELDKERRHQMYHDMQMMIHEDCGTIIPVFNNFLDAGSAKISGFVPTPTRQMSGYRAPEKVWFNS